MERGEVADFAKGTARNFGKKPILERNGGMFCPKGQAALSRSTSVKPPALPEVADIMRQLSI